MRHRSVKEYVAWRQQEASGVQEDIGRLQEYVSAYNFNPELNALLDKVGSGLAAGLDGFDQAAMLKHLRTFFEYLHRQVAEKLQKMKPETKNNTDLGKCQQAIDYLVQKGVLTDKMGQLGRAIYGVLSNEGVHAIKSPSEYVRLCRNMAAEYAMVLFFELERRLQD